MIFLQVFTKRKTPIKKIGILYICTGKYNIFWDGFYTSANKYFCKDSEVHFFVFTESRINNYENEYVHHIYQEKLGWPFDTLKRFHLFLDKRGVLENMDYLFFFNANMEFKKEVRENEILPKRRTNGLVSVLHSGFFQHKHIPPFEDNIKSVAYIKGNKNLNYFQGCLSGGRTKEYLAMAAEIKNMVEIDLTNSIIGKWWDESYMNKYFITHPPRALPPSFAYPQGGKINLPVKILMFEKRNFGGHDFLRS